MADPHMRHVLSLTLGFLTCKMKLSVLGQLTQVRAAPRSLICSRGSAVLEGKGKDKCATSGWVGAGWDGDRGLKQLTL